MEMKQPSNRIHPLVAGAAVSVMLVSLVGIAAMTGALPKSHATAAQSMPIAAPAPTVAPIAAPVHQVATVPAARNQGAVRKNVVHHHPVQQARAQSSQGYARAPVYTPPAPVAQNSPVGIGLGAVVGGLLGNQVGGGNGKTLATVAGAVGGAYLGNEIAKRNP